MHLFFTGCNKKIKAAKYLEKYTLDRKRRKIRIQCFLHIYQLSADAKIDDLSALTGDYMGETLKIQIGRYVLLHIFENVT